MSTQYYIDDTGEHTERWGDTPAMRAFQRDEPIYYKTTADIKKELYGWKQLLCKVLKHDIIKMDFQTTAKQGDKETTSNGYYNWCVRCGYSRLGE